ncbi:MAG: class I adenylate-forming enzyme family protein [Acidimicrobiales bacterium]
MAGPAVPAPPEPPVVGTPSLDFALGEACARFADRVALVADGTTLTSGELTSGELTYGELWRAAGRLALAYQGLGVAPGDRVVCWLANGIEHLVGVLGAWRAGAVHVGADVAMAPPELAWQIVHAGAAAVLGPGTGGRAAGLTEAVERARHQLPSLAVVQPDPGPPRARRRFGSVAGHQPPADPIGSGSLAGSSPDDVAVIFYSSGTTAIPKGVTRRHGELNWGWARAGRQMAVTKVDVHLVELPLAHGFGFGMAIMGLLTGGRLVLMDRFSPRHALDLIGRHGVSVLHGTPPHFRLLLDHLDPARHDVSTLRVGRASAAPFPPALIAGILDDLGMDLTLVYGSSEGVGWTTTDRDDMLTGSVGRPPANRIRVVGPGGEPIPTGLEGEIEAWRTHRFSYWGGPDSPAGGWHQTGDVGRIDADGRLYVLGRVVDQINRGGVRVDPTEVESALLAHARLLDAAVVGIPDPVLGQAICACVVPAAGPTPQLDDIRGALAPHLGRHKLPDRLCLVEQIPRSPLGKVHRAAVLALSRAQAGESTRPPTVPLRGERSQ